MPNNAELSSYVQNVILADDMDKRIAFASVRIGDVLIRGVAVWRGAGGKLRVFFPSYRLGNAWYDAIDLPEDLRTEVEAEVIAAYKETKAAAQAEQRQKGERLKHSASS